MPLLEHEEAELIVHCGDQDVYALIQVRPENPDPEPGPPSTLEFERSRYSVSVNKQRNLVLRAPLEDVVKAGSSIVRVSADGEGIAVMSGTVNLEFDDRQLCFIGKVLIDPRTLGSTTTLTAVLGDLLAECQVVVSKHGSEGPNLEFRFNDDPPGPYRASTEKSDDLFIITINRSHKSLKRYMTRSADNEILDSPIANSVIAEIVAFELAKYFVALKYQSAGELDGPFFYSEHIQYVDKYLTICHQKLVNV
jgi:hypothetical protein